MTQIIEYNGFVSLGGQKTSHSTPDIPRTAGNQYLHKNTVLPRTLWFTVSLLQQARSERLGAVHLKDRQTGGMPCLP